MNALEFYKQVDALMNRGHSLQRSIDEVMYALNKELQPPDADQVMKAATDAMDRTIKSMVDSLHKHYSEYYSNQISYLQKKLWKYENQQTSCNVCKFIKGWKKS